MGQPLQRNRLGYSSWNGMKTRCYNKNNNKYPRYGGRGIVICDRWLHSFDNFIEDMESPTKGMTIERINNDGNYEPNNCKWATLQEQASNRHTTKFVTINGETLTLKQWAIKKGIKYTTVWQRLNTYGWTIERSLGI